MDEGTVKTPNLKGRLYWCLKSLQTGDTLSHVGFPTPLVNCCPSTFSLTLPLFGECLQRTINNVKKYTQRCHLFSNYSTRHHTCHTERRKTNISSCLCLQREKNKKFYALQGPLHKAWLSTEVGGLRQFCLINRCQYRCTCPGSGGPGCHFIVPMVKNKPVADNGFQIA